MLCMHCLVGARSPTFPLFLHLDHKPRGSTRSIHTHTSIDKTVFRPVPSRGSACAARRVALAPVFNLFFFFCNVTFRSPYQVNKVCIFFYCILNSVGKSIHTHHGPVKTEQRRGVFHDSLMRLNSEGIGLIIPKVLSSRSIGSGRTACLYSRSEPILLSYLTRHVSSFASPTVSKRLESVWKYGR